MCAVIIVLKIEETHGVRVCWGSEESGGAPLEVVAGPNTSNCTMTGQLCFSGQSVGKLDL